MTEPIVLRMQGRLRAWLWRIRTFRSRRKYPFADKTDIGPLSEDIKAELARRREAGDFVGAKTGRFSASDPQVNALPPFHVAGDLAHCDLDNWHGTAWELHDHVERTHPRYVGTIGPHGVPAITVQRHGRAGLSVAFVNRDDAERHRHYHHSDDLPEGPAHTPQSHSDCNPL